MFDAFYVIDLIQGLGTGLYFVSCADVQIVLLNGVPGSKRPFGQNLNDIHDIFTFK